MQKILAKNSTIVHAENGARIKAFGSSASATSTTRGWNGIAQNITFQDFTYVGCDLPIVIDQYHETDDNVCAQHPSKVLNDVHYIDIAGKGTKR